MHHYYFTGKHKALDTLTATAKHALEQAALREYRVSLAMASLQTHSGARFGHHKVSPGHCVIIRVPPRKPTQVSLSVIFFVLVLFLTYTIQRVQLQFSFVDRQCHFVRKCQRIAIGRIQRFLRIPCWPHVTLWMEMWLGECIPGPDPMYPTSTFA
jgi:hypothetical protein